MDLSGMENNDVKPGLANITGLTAKREPSSEAMASCHPTAIIYGKNLLYRGDPLITVYFEHCQLKLDTRICGSAARNCQRRMMFNIIYLFHFLYLIFISYSFKKI